MMRNNFLSKNGEPRQPTLEVIDLLQTKVMVSGVQLVGFLGETSRSFSGM